MMTKDIYKVITDTSAVKKVKDIVIKRLLAAFLVFFVPTLIDLTLDALNDKTEYSKCWNNADDYKAYDKYEVPEADNEIYSTNKKYSGVSKNKTSGNGNNNGNSGTSTSEIAKDGSNYNSIISSISTPTMDELKTAAAKSENGISEEYLKWIIGTTYGEGYRDDLLYLSYAWASAFINNKFSFSQIEAWPPAGYYYESKVMSEYNEVMEAYNTSNNVHDKNFKQDVLKSVYLALTNKNTKIVGCSGSLYDNATREYCAADYDGQEICVWESIS